MGIKVLGWVRAAQAASLIIVTQAAFLAHGAAAASAKLASVVTCDEAAMPSCATLGKSRIDAGKSPKSGIPTTKDGGTAFNFWGYFSPSSSATDASLQSDLAKMATPTASRVAKSTLVIDRVRASLQSVILNGGDSLSAKETSCLSKLKSTSAWPSTCAKISTEQTQMLFRLATVVVAPIDGADRFCTQDVIEGFPNAAYVASAHHIQVCPATYNLTEAQLVSTFGHEFAHVINPCALGQQLFKVSPTATSSDYARCDSDFMTEPDSSPTDDAKAVEQLRSTKTEWSVGDASVRLFSELKGCDILRPVAGSQVSQSKLFSKTESCAEQVNIADYKAEIERYAVARQPMFGGSLDKARKSVLDELPASCIDKTNEQFADAVGAKIVSLWAERSNWPKSTLQTAFLREQSESCLYADRPGYAADNYPTGHIRLATALNEAATARRLSCDAVHTPKLCPLELTLDESPSKATVNTKSKAKAGSAK